MNVLSAGDQDLRGVLARIIAEQGHAPSLEELAAAAGILPAEAEQSLRRLHEAHALLLHPHSCEPWAVHPFSLAPGQCWVETARRGYWANCLYCGFGIAAALKEDAEITTRIGGEGETAVYRIRAGELIDREGIFHLATPAGRWWDNVIYACSTFQPFRDELEIGEWCNRHAIGLGAVLTLDALWRFASDWYGNVLEVGWRKRSPAEVSALFLAHGFTGEFWSLPQTG